MKIGRWTVGLGLWAGKPLCWFGREYYDGWYYVLHLGPLYVERAP